MSPYFALQKAKSEEEVKDAYIKALGIKGHTKRLIDIQSDEIWFEAKDTGKHSSYAMFTQLLHDVQAALNQGEIVPPLLAVIDTESGDVVPVDFSAFEAAYQTLGDKLRPQVYELGFLRA